MESQSDGPRAEELVGALHVAFGDHHARAVHAKGIMVEGTFLPADEARSVSRASLFSGGELTVLTRFSDFTGSPDIPDGAQAANPRGMAVRFRLPNGRPTDVVAHGFNGFPVANAADFRAFLLAIGASGVGAAKPTALDRFLADHPIAKAFLETQKPAPESFATLTYYGVNAFRLTNQEGGACHARYRFVPRAGESFVPEAERAKLAKNYLMDELPSRLKLTPVVFDWLAQIAVAEDVIDDPSIAWPESRRLVKLGAISLTGMVEHAAVLDKATVFAPGDLPEGIEAADPMILMRHAAYPISARHRQ